MSKLIAKIWMWVALRYIVREARAQRTRENADRIRTKFIIEPILWLFRRAVEKTPGFTADDDLIQIMAWVFDGKDGDHRLQDLADTIKKERQITCRRKET